MRLEAAVADLRQRLGAASRRPAVVGHDLWIASGLEVALPETVLVCLQRCTAIDVLRDRGVEVFCLSEHVEAGEVAGKSSLELLAHPVTHDFLRSIGPTIMLAFKPSERLAVAASAVGASLVAGNLAAARRAENKIAFIDLAARAGVPTPGWRAVTLTAGTGFDSMASEMGGAFVVQAARGNAGQRTHMVLSQAGLDAVIAAEPGPVRVSPFVDGLPFTATGLCGPPPAPALKSWIEPCRQVTGTPWLTPSPLGSCGNAWGDTQTDTLWASTGEILEVLARELVSDGYTGVFGVDFVFGAEGPVVIEVNARMVASLPLATQLEAAAGRAPLLLHRLRQSLGAALEPGGPEPALEPASQLILHTFDGDGVVGITSGVYRLAAGIAPEYLRPGVWISDVAAPDEALILVREQGEPRSPGKEFARIYLRGSLGEQTPGIREAVNALRGN